MDAKPIHISYRSTLVACSIGYVALATVVNLTPILFVLLREQFGFTFAQLGLLVFINFSTQVTFDLVFSKAADRHGFRPFVVAAHVLIVIGFVLFALVPVILKNNPYPGFIVATMIFSAGGGLLELLLSPIVDAVPSVVKSTTMAFIHSFYAWGQIAVILITTVAIFIFGTGIWPWVFVFWALIPLFNFFLFRIVPMTPQVIESKLMRLRDLVRHPAFILAFAAILFGGAAEITMNQWTSAFMEKAMNLPKIIGDTVGMSLFALMLGTGRVLYGFFGARIKIENIMILGSLIAIFCYAALALTNNPVIGLAACAVCGFAVSMLWPGTLVVASKRFPLAGASLFAILAAAGDVGASLGPWAVGVVAEAAPYWNRLTTWMAASGQSAEQFGLRAGILVGILFPLAALICHILLKNQRILFK